MQQLVADIQIWTIFNTNLYNQAIVKIDDVVLKY